MFASPPQHPGRRSSIARSLGAAGLLASICLAGAAPASAAPAAKLVAPKANAEVSGTVKFTLSSSAGVERAVFTVDGRRRDADLSAPFRFGRNGLLDTKRLDDGRHRLTVVVTNRRGRTRTLSRVVVVDNDVVAESPATQPAASAPRTADVAAKGGPASADSKGTGAPAAGAPAGAPAGGGLNDGASYYVDSVAGSDANSGTSPAAAWKSTSKASSAALPAGSNLLFKRGGSWTGTLTIAESGVAVGSYGAGDRPKFSAGNTGGCVLVTGNDNRVFDLYIDRCGVRAGIRVNGDRNLFQRNYVTHNAAGVEIPTGADSNRFYGNELIANNVMTKNTCGGDDDYGAYSFANEGGTNSDIGWNTIRDAKASSCDYGVDGSALEIYRGSAHFHHNVVSGNPAGAEMSGVAWARIEFNVFHDGEVILQPTSKFAGANTNVRVVNNTTNERILGWVGANPTGTIYAARNLHTQGLWSGTTGFIVNVDNKQIARSALDANLKPIAGSLAYGAYAPGGMIG